MKLTREKWQWNGITWNGIWMTDQKFHLNLAHRTNGAEFKCYRFYSRPVYLVRTRCTLFYSDIYIATVCVWYTHRGKNHNYCIWFTSSFPVKFGIATVENMRDAKWWAPLFSFNQLGANVAWNQILIPSGKCFALWDENYFHTFNLPLFLDIEDALQRIR